MKKLAIFCIIIFFIFTACKKQKHTIEGVWMTMGSGNPSSHSLWYEFSWGRRQIPYFYSYIFDLHRIPPVLLTYQGPPGRITNVIEKGNKTELTFFSMDSQSIKTFLIIFNKDGTMRIDSVKDEDGPFWPHPFSHLIYKKMDGP